MTKAAPRPDIVARWLDDFIQSAKDAFKHDLLSVTLFGSAAEGRLRPSSDVNLILVLKRFDQTAADAVSELFQGCARRDHPRGDVHSGDRGRARG